ncbi:hypothetical protein [Pareuzebyella sediminis]|uniref:hypothetical protein n=1 Tax=Pareuzebyella sediminis TaxID=2607998 RepID=UPI001E356A4B|nr:hypothetical protein [Pareuzebyella sediminis]
MQRLKDTSFYGEAIHEITYSFGNYYLFDGFVVAEINEDVVFTWEQHGKIVTKDLTDLYDTNGDNIVLITNRINPYSVKPADWVHFFKHSYKLKGYAIVTYSHPSYLNALLEKLFLNTLFKRFRSLNNAIEWAKSITHNRTRAS